jgi:hypothetical protein
VRQAGTTARIAEWLRSRSDCGVEDGLSEQELGRAEERSGITMPPLWRAVLRLAHPVALPKPPRDEDGVLRWTPFPDWRLRDEPGTRELVERPVLGILFDVEHNGFWWHDWGVAPTALSARIALAKARLATVPRLTPLWGHLYVADDDYSPVFSIVQTDLYTPALSLTQLVDGHDNGQLPLDQYPIGSVPFWSLLHAYSQIGHLTHFGTLASGGL